MQLIFTIIQDIFNVISFFGEVFLFDVSHLDWSDIGRQSVTLWSEYFGEIISGTKGSFVQRGSWRRSRESVCRRVKMKQTIVTPDVRHLVLFARTTIQILPGCVFYTFPENYWENVLFVSWRNIYIE